MNILNVANIDNEKNFWLVRTKKGFFYNEYISKSFIALGWNTIDANVLKRTKTKEDVKEKLSGINDILTMSSENIKIGFTYGLATISIDSNIEKDEIFSCADRMLYMEKKKKKVGR